MTLESNLREMEREREAYWLRYSATSPVKLRWRALGPPRSDISAGRILCCRSCGVGSCAVLPSEETRIIVTGSSGLIFRELTDR